MLACVTADPDEVAGGELKPFPEGYTMSHLESPVDLFPDFL